VKTEELLADIRVWIFLIIALTLVLSSLDYFSTVAEAPTLVETGLVISGLGDEPVSLVAPVGTEIRQGVVPVEELGLKRFFLVIYGEERPLVYLGAYRVVGVGARRSGSSYIVFLELEKGGRGEVVELKGLKPFTEVYGVFRGEKTYVIPLARVLPRDSIVVIKGRAEGCEFVEVYAYKAAELYNESEGPDPYLWITRTEVSNEFFEARIDLTAGPKSRKGTPLVSENRVLLIYGLPHNSGEASTWVSLEEITGGVAEVTLKCGP